MQKITKEEIVELLKQLKEKGYGHAELAVLINRTTNTIWAWSSNATKRVPCKSDFEILKRLL